MRILHLSQPTTGGTAVVVRQLVEAGLQAGHQVTVACPADGSLAGWATDAGATWSPVDMQRPVSARDAKALWAVRRLVREGFDVVHMHSSKAGALGRFVVATMRACDRPATVFTPHGWSWYSEPTRRAAYEFVERRLTPYADRLVPVSPEELVDGRAVLGPSAAMTMIANGVDLEAFGSVGPEAARPSTASLVVQVGRLCRQKGQDRAIRALARSGRRDMVMRFVGDGPDLDALMGLVRELDLADVVEFVPQTDPRPHLRAADVVLIPSRWEGMPLALLEAMSVGKCVLATSFSGISALGAAGIVVEQSDSEEATIARLAAELSRLLDDRAGRVRLGADARARCEAHFGLALTTKAYGQVWSEVAAMRLPRQRPARAAQVLDQERQP